MMDLRNKNGISIIVLVIVIIVSVILAAVVIRSVNSGNVINKAQNTRQDIVDFGTNAESDKNELYEMITSHDYD